MKRTQRRYRIFAEMYISNGRNATEAYFSISPKVTQRTAEVEGSKYLNKPEVAKIITKIEDRMVNKLEITRESQVRDLQGIKVRNEIVNDKVAIEAIKEQNKMLGFLAPEQRENLNKNIDLEITNEDKKDIRRSLDQLRENGEEESTSGGED